MEAPRTRKPIRLAGYDYSLNGCYFVTVCARNRARVFGEIVGTPIGRPQLSLVGEMVQAAIESIPNTYPLVEVDKYVILPNHVHMILTLHRDDGGRPMGVPTIPTIINQWKGIVTKQVGHPVWQPRFFDHVIRDADEHAAIRWYIEENPRRWLEDEYH